MVGWLPCIVDCLSIINSLLVKQDYSNIGKRISNRIGFSYLILLNKGYTKYVSYIVCPKEMEK